MCETGCQERRAEMEDKITDTCADCKERKATQDCTCCQKKKERSDKEYRDLMNRLKRIEGQVRGIQGMLEKDAYCTDIMVQVAAVNAALNSFNKVLLTNHCTPVWQKISARAMMRSSMSWRHCYRS